MDSILICITFKSGCMLERVYVRVMGADTLLYVISNFDYIWSVLCKDKKFKKHHGYVVSVEDVDCMLVPSDHTIVIDF